MEFEQLRDKLDFDAIAQAILSTPGSHFSESEFKDCKKMVWALAESYAARDYEHFLIGETEREVVIGDREKFLGYIDLECKIPFGCTLKPFSEYGGARVCVDWKTRTGELDQNWRNRLILSWQHKIYSYIWGATLFIFRGVNEREETKEVIIETASTNNEEVEEYVMGALKMRDALIDAKMLVWPRKLTPAGSPCYAFGRDCPYLDDCEEYAMPRQVPLKRRLSYSSLETFFLCQERYRRDTLLREESDEVEDSEATARGRGVHEGLAELYNQLRRLQQT